MESLGLDAKLLLAQIVNFAVLYFLLTKFLYKPVTKLLDERREKIVTGISDSEKAAKELEKAELASEKIKEKAYKEANEILTSAKDQANKEAAEIIKKTSLFAQQSMDEVQKEKLIYKEKVHYEIKKEVSDVIILALDKIVGSKMTSSEKEKITAKVLKEL